MEVLSLIALTVETVAQLQTLSTGSPIVGQRLSLSYKTQPGIATPCSWVVGVGRAVTVRLSA